MNRDIWNIFDEMRSSGKGFEPTIFADRISELGLSFSAAELPALTQSIVKAFGGRGGEHFVPQLLMQVVAKILNGRSADVVCDPWAGLGAMLANVCEATHSTKAFAFTQNTAELALGRALVRNAEWELGEPLQLISSLKSEIDVAASILPFGMKSNRPIVLKGQDGNLIELQGDFGNQILVATAKRLNKDGVGIFVITASFFFSQRSILRQFAELGLAIDAAFALPPGAFAPYANISTYLVVVRKRPIARMFVAQLTNDENTNTQIVSNFNEGKEGGTLELGRFVDMLSFTGLDVIRAEELFQKAERKFCASALRLEELATTINLGRHGADFKFSQCDNAIFIPMIGISDVVDSLDCLTLKPQNYAQAIIAPERSNARFVARFLNSELGKEIRELGKTGTTIPKLNRQTLANLRVLVPDLQTQKAMLGIEARIAAEQNTLFGLQNELGELRLELWSSPQSAPNIDQRLNVFSNRLSGNFLKQHAAESMEQWFETLPFPLASILRAWQATPSQDFKTKYEHLLHFFEGAAEFTSVILLSAFSSNEAIFEEHRQKLAEAMLKNKVNLQRATFGTWKLVVEYLGKQTRQLLAESGKKDAGEIKGRQLCAEIFSDPTLELPSALSRIELGGIFQATNKMRNDWSGHGGVVSQEEAQRRNELLVGEFLKMREAIADTWAETQLIRAVRCDLRSGIIEAEMAIMKGSNSEFLKETRSMASFLDIERLYLSRKDSLQALKLLPLVQVGPSPQSAKNACYFFNRLERDGARFVSYHFSDKPELTDRWFDEATAVINFLTISR